MTMDRVTRLNEIGAALVERPDVLDAAITLLEAISPADPARPERYEIIRAIGAGAQGEVFLGALRGEDEFRRLVVIKRVPSDVVNATRLVMNLTGEARLACRLSHPNVVAVLDVGRDKAGQPFLVMEYIDGVDLRKLMETGPVPPHLASFIVRELLSALGYIHQPQDLRSGRSTRLGLVHRDVSPSNVLLSWEGEVKLADFGSAQVTEGGIAAPTSATMGKPGYMSPEQANRAELDGRSDLYAVGIVLWELLAGRGITAGSPNDATARAGLQTIPRPSRFRREVPPDLETVAMRLVAYDREERYRTAELAEHDLMRCQSMPRDGRGELARLLDVRFPRARRQRPNSHPSGQRTPSEGRTLTAPPGAAGAPPWPWSWQRRQAADRHLDAMLRQARWRRRVLTWGVLLALLLAAAITFLVVR